MFSQASPISILYVSSPIPFPFLVLNRFVECNCLASSAATWFQILSSYPVAVCLSFHTLVLRQSHRSIQCQSLIALYQSSIDNLSSSPCTLCCMRSKDMDYEMGEEQLDKKENRHIIQSCLSSAQLPFWYRCSRSDHEPPPMDIDVDTSEPLGVNQPSCFVMVICRASLGACGRWSRQSAHQVHLWQTYCLSGQPRKNGKNKPFGNGWFMLVNPADFACSQSHGPAGEQRCRSCLSPQGHTPSIPTWTPSSWTGPVSSHRRPGMISNTSNTGSSIPSMLRSTKRLAPAIHCMSSAWASVWRASTCQRPSTSSVGFAVMRSCWMKTELFDIPSKCCTSSRSTMPRSRPRRRSTWTSSSPCPRRPPNRMLVWRTPARKRLWRMSRRRSRPSKSEWLHRSPLYQLYAAWSALAAGKNSVLHCTTFHHVIQSFFTVCSLARQNKNKTNNSTIIFLAWNMHQSC